MDIRSRAESLRPVRYFLNYKQRDQEPNFAGPRSRPQASGSDSESQSAASAGGTLADGSSIAVIGMGCRFPDADDPAALLDLVLTGRRFPP